MKILFVSSGNNNAVCPIAFNQANSIMQSNTTVQIEHYRVIGKGIWGYLGNIKPLRQKIKGFQPDVIHSHYAFCGYLSVLTFTKIPKVTSLMGSDVQSQGAWNLLLRIFGRNWNTVIVKSQEMYVKSGIKKALIIPNGVNINNFNKIDKAEARLKLDLNPNKKYILFLSDPSRPEKNHKLARQSVNLLRNSEISLLTVFDVSFEVTKYYYYACDVVLLTSKYEGSPNVIKEALVCNKPIVSTKVGDVEQLLQNLPGTFCVSADANEISKALNSALAFTNEISGRKQVLDLGIDSHSIAKKIISIYYSLVEKYPNQNQHDFAEQIINQTCSLGLWDSTIPKIKFNQEGVSNYALLQLKMMNDYPRGEVGKKQWLEIVESIKRSGKNKKYDCIIGVSGGVDSSYLMLLAVKAGLKPLAVHLDNGFNSEIAVENIYKMIQHLNVDLETHVINYEEIKDLFRTYMRASLPWIDAPTDLAIKATMYRVAKKYGVKYILRGNDFRSEGKQPTDWTYSDAKQLVFLHAKFGNNVKLKTYPLFTLLNLIYTGFLRNVKDIRPYYFIEYKKQDAKEILIKDFGWRDYGGHHHENLFTKFAMAYWLPKKFGIDKRKINLSAQIVSGAVTKEEAIQQIGLPFDSEKELESLKDFVLKKLDLKDAEFESMLNSTNKKFSDYPNNYNFIYSNIGKFKWLIKRLYAFKPMSIDSKKLIDY